MKLTITAKGLQAIMNIEAKHGKYTVPHFVLAFLKDCKEHTRREVKKHVKAKQINTAINFLLQKEYILKIKTNWFGK